MPTLQMHAQDLLESDPGLHKGPGTLSKQVQPVVVENQQAVFGVEQCVAVTDSLDDVAESFLRPTDFNLLAVIQAGAPITLKFMMVIKYRDAVNTKMVDITVLRGALVVNIAKRPVCQNIFLVLLPIGVGDPLRAFKESFAAEALFRGVAGDFRVSIGKIDRI